MKKASDKLNSNIIFLGGDILTVDEGNRSAEALAIKNGVITAIGKYDDVLQQKVPETRIVDLSGKTLMPGLVEPHSHIMLSAFFYDFVDVSGFTHNTETGVLERLYTAADRVKPGEWIKAFGYDPVQNRELRGLSADILDSISSTNPVFVMQQNMHTCFVNHKAFEVLEITEQTPQPEFGEFLKDYNGNLTGVIIEQGAIAPFVNHIALENQNREYELLEKQLKSYAEVGYTTVGDMGAFSVIKEWEDILKQLILQENCPIRMTVVNTAIELERGQPINIGSYGDRLRESAVKFWYDGSFLTGNVLLENEYLQSELMLKRLRASGDNWQRAMMPKETLNKLVKKYHELGNQVIIHAHGDRAIRDVIDAYEAALKLFPRENHRHRIEHCGLFPIDEMARAQKLGITPSIMITYLYHYGDAIRDEIIGPERANIFLPAGSAVNAGLRISFHNDSPMFPAEPFKLMKTAVTRKNRKGEVIGKDQAVSIDEAIRAVTINAAYQLFLDDKIGSLEIGKLADLTLLSENPRKIDPDRLDQIQVIETWLEGQQIMLSNSTTKQT